MTLPRKSLISLDDTPYYHCVSRCVRRAFLCGFDHYSKTDYEHRRDWLEEKLLATTSVFAIKLCAYAVMSNHYHVVLHVRSDIAQDWDTKAVIERWHSLFNGTLFSQQYLAGEVLSKSEMAVLEKDAKRWKERLCSISWLMKIINEYIARKANAEDECTGRFWEGRFKSQALLDERALLSCMAYVDLNPIRAKMAKTPETSDFTSVKQRIESAKHKQPLHKSLERFVGNKNEVIGIPFTNKDYLKLVDWSGRIIREGKRGFIQSDTPPILQRLSLEQDAWRILTTEFEDRFNHWVGSEHIVKQVYETHNYSRPPPTSNHKALFG